MWNRRSLAALAFLALACVAMPATAKNYKGGFTSNPIVIYSLAATATVTVDSQPTYTSLTPTPTLNADATYVTLGSWLVETGSQPNLIYGFVVEFDWLLVGGLSSYAYMHVAAFPADEPVDFGPSGQASTDELWLRPGSHVSQYANINTIGGGSRSGSSRFIGSNSMLTPNTRYRVILRAKVMDNAIYGSLYPTYGYGPASLAISSFRAKLAVIGEPVVLAVGDGVTAE